jgi:hypothetical protein
MTILKQLKTQLEADKEMLKSKQYEIDSLLIRIAEHESAIYLLEKGGLK